MADIIIFSVFDIYLINLATILLIVTALRYFGLAKKKENQSEKSIVNAYALFFIFLTIYSILINLSFLYLESKYIDYIYYGNFKNPSIIYIWLTKCAMASYFVALCIYFYTYEKILNKRIYFATFASIFIIILIFILPYEFVFYQMHTIIFAIFGLYFLHTLFTLMKWSQKQLRASTSFIILGSWFIGIFVGYMSPAFMRLGVTPLLIFPILLIIGILLCIAPTVLKPKFFSRNINYWYFFSIIIISAQLISLIYTIIQSGINIYILSPLPLVIFFVVECVILIRFIKREEVIGRRENTRITAIFTRPEKISEEEVSVSKEKKICLVCKGRLGRFMFMCPDCNTFYCENCARTLSDLENICWVCDTPFDLSKPVKRLQKEEEQIIIEKINNFKKDEIKQGNNL